jgi:hypothetical protein
MPEAVPVPAPAFPPALLLPPHPDKAASSNAINHDRGWNEFLNLFMCFS